MPFSIDAIEVINPVDCGPDLSWLEQTDEEMGEGFEASAKERIDAYNRDEWYMLGVVARAYIVQRTPQGGWHNRQRIESGGLWGIESDSGDDYLNEVANEQLDELADILAELGCDPAEIAVAIEEARP